MNKIGIKLANGEFYPVLDEGLPAKKGLTVTTVKDGQPSVQIDLYRGGGQSVLDAEYVGSLVVESIPPAPAGEPDIRLEIAVDATGTLLATVGGPGEEQSLQVSLEALGEERKYEIPDFDFEEDRTDSLPDEATTPEEGAGLLAAASELREEGRRRQRWPLFVGIAAILVIIVLALLAWYLFPSARGAAATRAAVSAAPASTVSAKPAVVAAAPAEAPAPAAKAAPAPESTAKAAPVAKAASPAPAAPTAKATATAPKGEQRYRLKWGDTLWDLAWVYYRDPWLYPRIAKANKIRNPDRILSGTWIVIPPR